MDSWGVILFAVWMNGKATQIHLGRDIPPMHLETEQHCKGAVLNLVKIFEDLYKDSQSIVSVGGKCYRIHEESI